MNTMRILVIGGRRNDFAAAGSKEPWPNHIVEVVHLEDSTNAAAIQKMANYSKSVDEVVLMTSKITHATQDAVRRHFSSFVRYPGTFNELRKELAARFPRQSHTAKARNVEPDKTVTKLEPLPSIDGVKADRSEVIFDGRVRVTHVRISVSLLRPLSFNPKARSKLRPDLMARVKEADGVHEELSLHYDEDIFRILNGHGRFAVCKELGIETVPARVYSGDKKLIQQLYINLNTSAKKLTGADELEVLIRGGIGREDKERTKPWRALVWLRNNGLTDADLKRMIDERTDRGGIAPSFIINQVSKLVNIINEARTGDARPRRTVVLEVICWAERHRMTQVIHQYLRHRTLPRDRQFLRCLAENKPMRLPK